MRNQKESLMQNLPLLNTSNAAPKAHTQGASKSGNIAGQSGKAGAFQQRLTHQIHQKSETRQQTQKTQQTQQTQQKNETSEDKTMVDKDATAADLIHRKIKGLSGKLALSETHLKDAGQSGPAKTVLEHEDDINIVDRTLIPASLNVLAQVKQTATGDAEAASTDPALVNTTALKTDGSTAVLAPAEGKKVSITAETDVDTKPVKTGMDKLAIAAENPRMQADQLNGLRYDSAKFDDMLPESLSKIAAGREPAAGMLQSQPVSVAQTAATNLASTNPVNTSLIMTPPGKEGWSQAIGQRVMWMIGAAQQSATLTLNPPEMGPLQIVINVHNDKADTAFFSDRQEVRQALEDGMGNLREMMKEAGINLGQTNINQRDKMAQDFTQHQQQTARQDTGNSALAAEVSSTSTVATRAGLGLVDTFA
jgi:flagellar hook-length control protein FliK